MPRFRTVKCENERTLSIVITKTDSEKEDVYLPGAEFELWLATYDEDTQTYEPTGETYIDIQTTNDQGKLTFGNLKQNTH